MLLWFAGYEWDLESGHLQHRGFRLPRAKTWSLSDDGLQVNEEQLVTQLLEANVAEHWLDYVISTIPGLARVNDRLVLWPRNIADKGAAVLSAYGHPMSPDELADLVPGNYSRQGFRDRLYSHPKVMRTGLREAALRVWGLDEYSGSINEMVKILQTEGTVPLAELRQRLSEQFGISPNSVSMYSAAPLFVVEDGMIRLRGNEPFIPPNEPSTVWGLFRSSRGQVIWHVEVDHDILRGSGRKIPNELALAVGVGVGSSVAFATSTDVVFLRWATTSHVGPSVGSLRAIAQDVTATEGQVLRLVFDTQRHTLHGSVTVPSPSSAAPAERIAALTGLPPEDCQSQADVAEAMFTTLPGLSTALQARSDHAIAELVAGLPAHMD